MGVIDKFNITFGVKLLLLVIIENSKYFTWAKAEAAVRRLENSNNDLKITGSTLTYYGYLYSSEHKQMYISFPSKNIDYKRF